MGHGHARAIVCDARVIRAIRVLRGKVLRSGRAARGPRPSTRVAEFCLPRRGERGAMRRVSDFAIDTALEGSGGRFSARLSRDWEIWGPNGGYVAAIALRAAGAATPLRRPASFACHF